MLSHSIPIKVIFKLYSSYIQVEVMASLSHILLLASASSTLEVNTLRAGARQIADLERVTNLKEGQLACQLRQHLAYLVAQSFLEQFLSSLPINHPPVIALVEDLVAGEKALTMGAEDYLVREDITVPIIKRSLRLTIKAHQNLLKLHNHQQEFQELAANNEAKYQSLFNLLPRAVVLVFDQQLRILFARGQALKSLTIDSENIQGQLLQDVTTPENFTLLEKYYQSVLIGTSPTFEINHENHYYLIYTSPIRDEKGNISSGFSIAYDITDRKYAEQALRNSEAKFRAIFERSPMGIALVSIERKIFQVNSTFCEILGYPELELIGIGARDITHPEDLEVTDSNIAYLLSKEANYFTLEKRYLCKDGSYCWVQSAVATVKDNQNHLQYMVLLITDIQERKQIEEQIQYRLHLESIVTTISQHLLASESVNLNWIIEILGKAMECDRAYINRFTSDLKYFSVIHEWHNYRSTLSPNYQKNVPVADYPGWFDTLKWNQDVLMNNVQDLLPGSEKSYYEENKIAACLEVPIFSSRGELWISLCFESIIPRSWLPEDAQILRLVGEMICSYHEKLNSQKELKDSESLYSGIFNHSIDNIFLLQVHYSPQAVNTQDCKNIKFTYKTINAANEQTLGISAAEIIGKTMAEVLSPEVAAWVEYQYLTCVQAGEVITYEESIALGTKGLCHYITTLVPIRDEFTGQIIKIQGSARDISQVKLAEQERLNQTYYQQLFFNLTLKIRSSSELSEILDTTVAELQKVLKLDRVMIWQFNSDRTVKTVSNALTQDLKEINNNFCNPLPVPLEQFQDYQQGKVLRSSEIEFVELTPDYQEFLLRFQIKSFLTLPIFLTQATQGLMLWGLLSLYDRKVSHTWQSWEVEQLQQMANQLGVAIYQAQLLEQERRNVRELAAYNTELKEFTYIASHDLQTPLGTISNYGSLLQLRYGEQLDGTGVKFLKFITSAAQRMQELIDDLLFYNLVNRDQLPLTPVDCNLVFQEVYTHLESEIIALGAIINCAILPTVLGSHFQLVQLFQCLLSNSLKYRGCKALVIDISAVSQDGKWLFSFRDNGIGLDIRHSDRIFQIFQRLHTQQEYSGTGVGLAVCKKVVEYHGGRIWVESQIGEGSTFFFTLNISSFF